MVYANIHVFFGVVVFLALALISHTRSNRVIPASVALFALTNAGMQIHTAAADDEYSSFFGDDSSAGKACPGDPVALGNSQLLDNNVRDLIVLRHVCHLNTPALQILPTPFRLTSISHVHRKHCVQIGQRSGKFAAPVAQMNGGMRQTSDRCDMRILFRCIVCALPW